MLLFLIYNVQYFWALFIFTARIKSLFIHFSYSVMIAKVTSFLIFFTLIKTRHGFDSNHIRFSYIHIHLVLPCCLCILCTIWASTFWLVHSKLDIANISLYQMYPQNWSWVCSLYHDIHYIEVRCIKVWVL